MTYTFKNTEQNNEKASIFETKALLYLIGGRKDGKNIEFLTFDCFNDVSGINKSFDKIWDIQSKNHKSLTPAKIGSFLFTLFDNFISIFPFYDFILFVPKLTDKYKINTELNAYKLTNIEKKILINIKLGLTKEVKRIKGENKDFESEIDRFLDKVLIVEDSQSEAEYIKSITKFKDKGLKDDDFYTSIFKHLRDTQSIKKLTYIENESIENVIDVLLFNRHLKIMEVETLIISKFIGCELFQINQIPFSFLPIIKHLDSEEVKDILQECNSNLSRAFLNKNSNKIFWEICEKIITYIVNDSKGENNINIIYNSIFDGYSIRLTYLDERTIKYLISIILQGLLG